MGSPRWLAQWVPNSGRHQLPLQAGLRPELLTRRPGEASRTGREVRPGIPAAGRGPPAEKQLVGKERWTGAVAFLSVGVRRRECPRHGREAPWVWRREQEPERLFPGVCVERLPEAPGRDAFWPQIYEWSPLRPGRWDFLSKVKSSPTLPRNLAPARCCQSQRFPNGRGGGHLRPSASAWPCGASGQCPGTWARTPSRPPLSICFPRLTHGGRWVDCGGWIRSISWMCGLFQRQKEKEKEKRGGAKLLGGGTGRRELVPPTLSQGSY